MKAWPVLSSLLITTGKLIVAKPCCQLGLPDVKAILNLRQLFANETNLQSLYTLIVVFNANNLFISLSALFFNGIETRPTDLLTIFIKIHEHSINVCN